MNAYDVLGVSPSAELDEIKKAYRRLALKFHPDRNKEAGAEERFKQVSEAWGILSSPDKKQEHDRNLHFQNMGGHSGEWRNFNRQDPIFEHFFRNHGFGGSWDDILGRTSRRQNQTYMGEAVLSLEDVASGISHKAHVANQDVVFNIPAGVDSGEILRVQINDFSILEVRITVTPHIHFVRKGLDVETQVAIPLQTALAGGEVRAPSLRGPDINLRIPAGVNSHAKLRVKGGGIQKGRSIGNSFYEIKIKIPKLEPTDLVDVLKVICQTQSEIYNG